RRTADHRHPGERQMNLTPPSRARLDAAAGALDDVLAFSRPADSVMSAHFRHHSDLGQRDRAFIAEAVFGVLRHLRTIDALAPDASSRRKLVAFLVRFAGISVRRLAAVLSGTEIQWAETLKAIDIAALPLAVKAELPDWLVERLGRDRDTAGVLALGRTLQEPAPLDLRVNTLKTDRDTVLGRLASDGITAQATPYSPVGVRLAGKPAINRHPLFTEGAIEVQDEGSQLLAYLVAPRRHDLVVDFCAGAGGKTLALGALMRSRGRLYAFDTASRRLERLRPRLARSGLSNVFPHVISSEHDQRIRRLTGKIDRVLVDAPCSGLGTLRRNPDLKWRQSPQSIAELVKKQASILAAAAALVKPGGRLVYATCSLLPDENADIIAAFLNNRPEFRVIRCGEILQQQHITLECGEFLELDPCRHNTDGFFAAALQHTASNKDEHAPKP
ncbi:MAG TPA: RsmB/NOP family class I SAM-dependent RNA methyltransferase, partial [Gammaproteobacteria bacterium]|nr:RsmB/NOP family class I SAM-dependent RNA methyltransferase [Gammaproteobacteria bacterium]